MVKVTVRMVYDVLLVLAHCSAPPWFLTPMRAWVAPWDTRAQPLRV